MTAPRYILTLSCKDAHGIVAAVSSFLARHQGFIIESAQFGDESTGQFFLRMEFSTGDKTPPADQLRQWFQKEIAGPFAMRWHLYDKSQKMRMLIMVSKGGHCLNDLLHRYSTGWLPVEIPAVVSNHRDLESFVEWHRIPYHYMPVEKGDKAAQEAKLWNLIESERIDMVVLARYMQILSPELCGKLEGRAINIHHSFLPSFKGAKPYQQAFDRGVKVIGATAHYVTTDLDEGPIIDQEVSRVDHSQSPAELESIGRDLECMVLARALKYHIEHRVLLNAHKTVVFK